ncbi:MAG: hypothetical protein ACOYXM_16740 [Actinomycetota bacterium]
MVGAEGNCPDRAMVTPKKAEMRHSKGQPAQASDGAAKRERVGGVSEYQRDGAVCGPQNVSEDLDSLREPASVEGQQHRRIEVRGDPRLFLDGFDEPGMVILVPRHEEPRQERAIRPSGQLV